MLPARRRSDKDRTKLCNILGSDTADCQVLPAEQHHGLLRAEVMRELCLNGFIIIILMNIHSVLHVRLFSISYVF